MVYDSTSRDSFNALSNWLNDARTLAHSNIVILLVGNKKDLEDARQIEFLEASNFAQENGKILSSYPLISASIMPRFFLAELIFLETSAKTGENVEEAFLKCSKTILAKIETGELDPERVGSGIQYGGSALRVTEPKTRQLSNCCRI